VIDKLKNDWSLEKISRRLKVDFPRYNTMRMIHEVSISEFIMMQVTVANYLIIYFVVIKKDVDKSLMVKVEAVLLVE
jgi:hypothetical protein